MSHLIPVCEGEGGLIGHTFGCATVSLSKRSVLCDDWTHFTIFKDYVTWTCPFLVLIEKEHYYRKQHSVAIPRLHYMQFAFILYVLYDGGEVCWLTYLVKKFRIPSPTEGGYLCICRRAAGSLVLLASRVRIHVSHWLPLLGMFLFFFHPCRCWSGILAADCQFAAQCPSVCRGERCDVVGYSSGGVLRHLSGLLQVMCAHRFAVHIPAHRICRVVIAVAVLLLAFSL